MRKKKNFVKIQKPGEFREKCKKGDFKSDKRW